MLPLAVGVSRSYLCLALTHIVLIDYGVGKDRAVISICSVGSIPAKLCHKGKVKKKIVLADEIKKTGNSLGSIFVRFISFFLEKY